MSLWHENTDAALARRRRANRRRARLAATAWQILGVALFLAIAGTIAYGCVRVARLAWGPA